MMHDENVDMQYEEKEESPTPEVDSNPNDVYREYEGAGEKPSDPGKYSEADVDMKSHA